MVLSNFYPNCETNKEIIVTSSIIGGLLYLLLIVYQPFGTGQFEDPYKYLLLFPYAIISAFSFYSINFLLTKNRDKWTIGLELRKILLIFLLISILSYFYNSLFVSKVNLSFENFFYMFLYTSALGIPLSAIYVLGRYIYLNKKNKPIAISNVWNNGYTIEPTKINDTKESNSRLHIVADYGNLHFDIEQKDFIYAEAADNYCLVYFYKNGVVQKEIIRISLVKLLNQVRTDSIKRVHRSFIVNLKKVTKFKGNALGYKILFDGLNQELKVSRSYIDSVIPVLKTVAVHP